jgi:hypothetical protein
MYPCWIILEPVPFIRNAIMMAIVWLLDFYIVDSDTHKLITNLNYNLKITHARVSHMKIIWESYVNHVFKFTIKMSGMPCHKLTIKFTIKMSGMPCHKLTIKFTINMSGMPCHKLTIKFTIKMSGIPCHKLTIKFTIKI